MPSDSTFDIRSTVWDVAAFMNGKRSPSAWEIMTTHLHIDPAHSYFVGAPLAAATPAVADDTAADSARRSVCWGLGLRPGLVPGPQVQVAVHVQLEPSVRIEVGPEQR